MRGVKAPAAWHDRRVSSDVLVIGGGIAGLTFAAEAARTGRSVLLVEKSAELGGCLATRPARDGFWIELGAHTCYNSYGTFLALLDGLGLLGELQARGKPVLRFLDGDGILPGKNLGALLRRMNPLRAALALPMAAFSRPNGKTVRQYYGGLVGANNYARALGPMLAAVPCQPADDFPADMLFKKRARRKDVMRSFTLRRGLGSVAAAVAALPGVTARTGVAAAALERAGGRFVATLDDGSRAEARLVALAVPPAAAAGLLGGVAPDAAAAAAKIGAAAVDSVGAVVAAEKCPLPYATFFIPVGDGFYSIVTRDVVPHPSLRGFAFHFKPGAAPAERLARVCKVLRVDRKDLVDVWEKRSVLPSPVLGHHATVAAFDAALAPDIAAAGNWFAGLSIEDCVSRARAEWRRLAGLTDPA
ncbi:MAG TPA: FAD-dependent oxidoreductase [Haliangiales bacterium]|nr:FAD-dependent oxidoreductase [Haliangiales bacterium]